MCGLVLSEAELCPVRHAEWVFDSPPVGCCYRLVGHVFFFFQAEDGIRDLTVTGVQTCALPISYDEDTLLRFAASVEQLSTHILARAVVEAAQERALPLSSAVGFEEIFGKGVQIGRASCRERV